MAIDKTAHDLTVGIVDFLRSSIDNGTVSSEDAESLEVAIECLTEIFGVDLAEKEEIFGKQNLLSVFSAFQRLRERKKSSETTSEPTSESAAASSTTKPSEEDKKKAEELKALGNKEVSSGNYEKAVELYTKAIELNSTNPIYYCNRAAAYSSLGSHDKAIEDAKKALEIDPKYAKAYSRLGFSLYSTGQAQAALEAYAEGLKIEGSNPSPAMQKGYETAKKKVAEDLDSVVPTQIDEPGSESSSTKSSPFGGSAPGGGGLADILNNPQVAAMAQKVMSDPSALQNIMNNPMLQQLAKNMGGGNGTPNFDELMNNPMLQQMAKNFMGGSK